MKKLLFFLAFAPLLLFAQTRKQRKAMEKQRKADQHVINYLKTHVQSLENKEAAAEYISSQFKAIGLQPKGTNGYLIPFKIDEGKQIAPATYLRVDGNTLALRKDYFPLSFSSAKSVSGMPAMALREKGVPWFADIKDWTDADTTLNDETVLGTVQKEAKKAAAKGATAFFVYNTSKSAPDLRFVGKDTLSTSPIPVIYITPQAYGKYFADEAQILDIELNVAFNRDVRNAANVAGFIDNGAATNIVIATPYYAYSAAEVADSAQARKSDILSGTSMLIELARMLASSKAKHNNYTFIAYTSASDLPSDSKWLNNSIVAQANYVINLDKVARYDDNKQLLIESSGTPPEWIENIKPLADKNLELSFAANTQKDALAAKVPVLNFSTATENATASRAGEINYQGEVQIARFIYRLIEATDDKGKMGFAAN